MSFEEKSGRIANVYSKRARGMMCRFLAENKVDSLEGIKKFKGYSEFE